ncbi:MAG: T9SS type A sorting domain-containing protein [Ignavibacteriae bacterium]|nr:T9SS type A sorting domain-containing protein [Ignavibacteriota bacterium]
MRKAILLLGGGAIAGIMFLPGVVSTSNNESEQKRTRIVTVGQNYRIYPSNVTQTETFIVRHPHNPAILFASANTINLNTGFISEGCYATTNSGLTWFGSDTCNGPPITFHGGDPGITIDKNGIFLLIRLGRLTPGLYSHFSTDYGRNWSTQLTIATNDQDRATLTSDGNPASSFYGRSYAVWVRFASPYPVFFAYTDNGGTGWSAPVQINAPSQRGQGGEVAMGPNGVVNVCWAAVINVSPFTEDFVGFASSSNGGATWTVRENVFDMNGIAGTFPTKGNIRVNGLPRIDVDKSGGSRNGWIYVVTTQRNLAPAGSDPDIILNRSTDGGATWSAGIRVNQDALNNGKFQYFPAIHVDDFGGVNVLYYDDRNTSSDSAGVFVARSVDGGNTWTDHQISDHTFKPQAIGGLGQGYQGDNIGMTSSGTTLWPVWMDNSSGIYQIWTSPTDITTLEVAEESGALPEIFSLGQNYPNPFNPSTNIGLRIADFGFVSLKIYDLLGREAATLVNEEMEQGSYEVTWNASGFASGVYLYRLDVRAPSGTFTQTRKMMLMK